MTAAENGNWYMVNKDGMATLCTDRADAEKEAEDAQSVWPHMGPHRAVQLVEVADVEALRTGYAAARLEIESLRASASEAGVLADLLNRRPAMNAGLVEAYARWTAEVYRVTGALATAAANDATQPAGAQQPGAAYAVYAELPDERAAFEARFPVPGGVSWNGSEYVVKDDYLNSYRCDRFVGQWAAWQARASHGQAPAQAAPAAVVAPGVRRIERTYFPNSPAHKALAAFCHAMHDNNIDGADMRAAMLWFLGLEEYEEQAAEIDPATMALAESVGLIGPASRTHDLHGAIQRFHDLICANATIKAAQMAAEAISEAAPQQEPVAWANWKVGSTSYAPYRTREQAVASVNQSGIAATQEGPYEVVALYTAPQTSPAAQGDALTQAARDVLAEVERATRKFPTWPTDPLHALAVLGEEFGELTKDMLQLTYEPHKTNAANVRTEALQTAAMALRLFMSLDRYEYRPGAQHSQDAARAAQEGK